MLWRPEFAHGLQIDFAYLWLDTEVKDTFSSDPLDRTGGDPDYMTLNCFGFHYVVRKD